LFYVRQLIAKKDVFNTLINTLLTHPGPSKGREGGVSPGLSTFGGSRL